MQSVEDKVRRNEESHNRHIEQLKGEVHTLSCENIKLRQENKSNDDQLQDLLINLEMNASALEDQIQYSRRNCLVVSGIAEKRGEDTDEIIQTFAAEKLGIELEDMDIDRSHRLGKKQVGKPRPIIVKFGPLTVSKKISPYTAEGTS